MPQSTSHRLAVATALAASVVAALALAGCGRKGPPELAPGTQADPVTRVIAPNRPAAAAAPITSPAVRSPGAASPSATAQAQTGPVVDDPGLIQPPNKSYQVPASTQINQAASTPARPPINRPPGPQPGKPFALDPLL